MDDADYEYCLRRRRRLLLQVFLSVCAETGGDNIDKSVGGVTSPLHAVPLPCKAAENRKDCQFMLYCRKRRVQKGIVMPLLPSLSDLSCCFGLMLVELPSDSPGCSDCFFRP